MGKQAWDMCWDEEKNQRVGRERERFYLNPTIMAL